jgi:hypothetical protein
MAPAALHRYFAIVAATAASAAHLVGSCIDFLQCAMAGGLGSSCSGADGLAFSLAIMAGIGFSLKRQQHFWLLIFFLQGAGTIIWLSSEAPVLDSAVGGDAGIRVHAAAVLLCCCAMVTFAVAIRRACRMEVLAARAEMSSRMRDFDLAWLGLRAAHGDRWCLLASRCTNVAAAIHARRKRAGGTLAVRLAIAVGLLRFGQERLRFAAQGKAAQPTSSLEELYWDAEELSGRFQAWVAGWSVVGEVLFSNVKAPDRAIQKTVRSYRRDPSHLTDLVRCSVVVGLLHHCTSPCTTCAICTRQCMCSFVCKCFVPSTKSSLCTANSLLLVTAVGRSRSFLHGWTASRSWLTCLTRGSPLIMICLDALPETPACGQQGEEDRCWRCCAKLCFQYVVALIKYCQILLPSR